MHNQPWMGSSNPWDNICILLKKGLTWQVVPATACTTSNDNKLSVNWGSIYRVALTGRINVIFRPVFKIKFPLHSCISLNFKSTLGVDGSAIKHG